MYELFWFRIVGTDALKSVTDFVVRLINLSMTFAVWLIKGCVCNIFDSLYCMCRREDLWNKEKCFLFYFESSFHSWDNQI